MAFKICSNCNEKVEDDWLLCKYCHVPMKNNTTEVTASSTEHTSGNYLKIILSVVTLIVVILILFALLK
ncbi:hypothetical protein CF651_11360 [Paenibacillus rigui]|uniref:Zinc ribbon domain-containing protein n=1 Tax=Paenibacillus rigui TaxID=554312 RepID=A0A229UQZ5_9BACL|nr:hypothetical protein CF651_11360 [Paenibacillus rigui]